MIFRVHGRPIQSLKSPTASTPGWEIIRAHLEKLPDGVLLLQNELASTLGKDPSLLTRMKARFDREGVYQIRVSYNLAYWGNPKTIRAARKEYADYTQRPEKGTNG